MLMTIQPITATDGLQVQTGSFYEVYRARFVPGNQSQSSSGSRRPRRSKHVSYLSCGNSIESFEGEELHDVVDRLSHQHGASVEGVLNGLQHTAQNTAQITPDN